MQGTVPRGHITTTTCLAPKMPKMEKGLFSGMDQPLAADWATFFVTSIEKQQIEELFEAHGWEEEASAAVGLCLGPNNTRVQAARLPLAGAWGEGPIAIQAQKIWPTAAEHLLLEVSLGDTSIFRFPEGEMASGYVARVHLARDNDGRPRPIKQSC